MSRAETLDVPAAALNRRLSGASAGLSGRALAVANARELAEVMQEATQTEAAVVEWWGVHMTGVADDDATREMVVQLVEELRPALRLARVFLRALI